MSYLLDTHTLAWWLTKPELIGPETFDLMSDENLPIFVSAITAYEVSNKNRLGKWPAVQELAHRFEDIVQDQGFQLLPISCEDAAYAGRLTSDHRDPFDRVLASQSMRSQLTVLTKDPKLAELGAATFW